MGFYLFTGKGGAGKTTCAAAFGYSLLRKGRKVLLASLDPAHNLGDVLREEIGNEAKEIEPGLKVLEFDFNKSIEERIRRTKSLVRSTYRHLSVSGLDPLVSLVGKAPGAEEQEGARALAVLYRDCRNRGEDLVLDLPPSGQATRMLMLPGLISSWCRNLMGLRKRILSGRDSIRHILGKELEEAFPGYAEASSGDHDRVLDTLESILELHGDAAKALAEEARVFLVTTLARMSLEETRRTSESLALNGIDVYACIFNMVDGPLENPLDSCGRFYAIKRYPFEPVGRERLVEISRTFE